MSYVEASRIKRYFLTFKSSYFLVVDSFEIHLTLGNSDIPTSVIFLALVSMFCGVISPMPPHCLPQEPC